MIILTPISWTMKTQLDLVETSEREVPLSFYDACMNIAEVWFDHELQDKIRHQNECSSFLHLSAFG